MKLLLTLFISLFGFSAYSNCIKGNGNIIFINESFDEFTSITNNLPFQATITYGEKYSVNISGDTNILELLTIDYKLFNLSLSTSADIDCVESSELSIHITVPFSKSTDNFIVLGSDKTFHLPYIPQNDDSVLPILTVLENTEKDLILIDNLSETKTVFVVDAQGTVAKSLVVEPGQPIDISNLSSGSYSLNVDNHSVMLYKK